MRVVKFYLMKKDNEKNSLKKLNERYISMFCQVFGGCTTYQANGYWFENGKLIFDKDIVCEIFIENKFSLKFLYAFFKLVAIDYKKEAKQLAVSYEIDGHAHILEN